MANKVVLILRWCAIADLCPSYSGFAVKLLRNTGTFPLFLFFFRNELPFTHRVCCTMDVLSVCLIAQAKTNRNRSSLFRG